MKFRELLMHYRESANLSKSQLAERLGLSPEYIINVENGQTRKPPTIDRCKEIARILHLSPVETNTLIDAAIEERLSPEELLWLTEREKRNEKIKEVCTEEILAALSDPVAVKALLATYKSKEDVKAIVQDVIENLNHLSKEQRREMLKFCQ